MLEFLSRNKNLWKVLASILILYIGYSIDSIVGPLLCGAAGWILGEVAGKADELDNKKNDEINKL